MTASSDMATVHIRTVKIDDLDACCRIESACFSPAEAASRASIETRIKVFPDGYLVAECTGEVVGQINSGATDRDDITDEAFKQLVGHVPNGTNLVVFSLSVLPGYRKQGIAGALLRQFVHKAKDDGRRAILLLCKPALIPYYHRFGFVDCGESASTHGGVRWHEMALVLVYG